MTDRLTIAWPDPAPFRGRGGRPIRLLAVSDEVDQALESEATRASLAPLDLIVGCGDLQPPYLAFLADALAAPLAYVRGNHDVGAAWGASEAAILPEPMRDGRVREESGLRLIGFSGGPEYAARGPVEAEQQISGFAMWRRVLAAWPRAIGRRPILVVSHAAPRGANDGPDPAHLGFTSLRWLLDRLAPPLWLHGHTSLIRRGVDGRCTRYRSTVLVNVTGATLVELTPPTEAPAA